MSGEAMAGQREAGGTSGSGTKNGSGAMGGLGAPGSPQAPPAAQADRRPRTEHLPPLPYHLDDHGEHVFPPRLLTDLIDTAVATWPARTAVDFFGRTWSYALLGELIGKATRGLHMAGLAKGDRIGLAMGNSPYHLVLYFAAFRLGAVVVNVNPLYTRSELEHLVRDSALKMIAVPEMRFIHEKVEAIARATGIERIILCRMADVLPPVKRLGFRLLRRSDHVRITQPDLVLELRTLLAGDGPPPPPVPLEPEDLAVLQYTGGTTGRAKAAMLSHRALAANSAQMLAHFGGRSEGQERTLGVLPMFHVFALTCVLNYSIETGAELVLLPRFEMNEVLAGLKRKPPTVFYGVPTIYAALGSLPDGKVPDMTSTKCCLSGGAPLPYEIRETFERRTGARVVEGYGLTEASPIIACNPLFGLVKDNSCGPRFPGTELFIRDPEPPYAARPQGERGEVCARGPQLMTGYWQKPEATAAVFHEGAVRTGDIGYLDEDGYLFLVDRIKDLILCGGYNVYPREIEDAAYHHPDVHEAIAIGIPDAYRGETPKLFVTPVEGSGLTPESLHAFLAERLNKIELPSQIEFRSELPRTLIGKLSKKELVEEERRKRIDDA